MINLYSVAADSTTHHACQSDLALLMKGVWPLKKKNKTKKNKIHTGHRLLSNLFSAQLVLNEVIMTH